MSCSANEDNLATGWVRLYRSIFDDETYPLQEHRLFTKFEAKLDLLLQVRGTTQERMFDGKLITVERGNQIFSYSFLARRWCWSIKKVRRFLGSLQTRGYLELKSGKTGTLITIVNYNNYNPLPMSRAHRGNAEGTQWTLKGQQYNEGKKVKKESSDSRINELREWYATEYLRVYGADYISDHGNDDKALQDLLATLPLEDIKDRVTRFLSDPQKQKKGKSVHFFRTCAMDYPPTNGHKPTKELPLEVFHAEHDPE